MKTEYHVLNLGAGVQSTVLYLLSLEGKIQRFDCAIFADTQDEPGAEERRRGLPDPPESVYAHLDWLRMVGTGYRVGPNQCVFHKDAIPFTMPGQESGAVDHGGIPILVRTAGCISADLGRGENNTGQRFASIPAFTAARAGDSEPGQVRRQCTKEYKIEVIERAIRRDVLGLRPKQHYPRSITVHQYIGISWDERSRAFDIQRRFLNEDGAWKRGKRVHFPLLTLNGEHVPGWRREPDCRDYLKSKVPHKVFGSSCIHCPFHSDDEWRRVLAMGASAERLIQIDTRLREPGAIANRNLDQSLYLHRSCRPITEVDLSDKGQAGFLFECEGGCGL